MGCGNSKQAVVPAGEPEQAGKPEQQTADASPAGAEGETKEEVSAKFGVQHTVGTSKRISDSKVVEKYNIEGTLGSGGFGEVKLGVEKTTGKRYDASCYPCIGKEEVNVLTGLLSRRFQRSSSVARRSESICSMR